MEMKDLYIAISIIISSVCLALGVFPLCGITLWIGFGIYIFLDGDKNGITQE